MEAVLNFLNDFLCKFLSKNVSIMPKSFTKWIAYYYPDARIRKTYLEKLNVFLGEGTYANIGFIGVNDGIVPIVVGDYVSIAVNCVCIAKSSANNGTTINDIPYVRDVLTKQGTITIGDNSWIGANVTVLPGVTIGHHCIIGAGSVVTKDTEPFAIYAGVPAKKMKDLEGTIHDE